MRAEDVKVRKDGASVDCVLMCKTKRDAISAYDYADENPPLGYILLMGKLRRRPRGGRARFLTLCFRHTGNDEHPPMTEWICPGFMKLGSIISAIFGTH